MPGMPALRRLHPHLPLALIGALLSLLAACSPTGQSEPVQAAAAGASTAVVVAPVATLSTTSAHVGAAVCRDATDMNGFSLHAAVRRVAEKRQVREQLCRYIARPALIAGVDERESADRAAGGTSIGLIRGSNPSGRTELELTSFLHHFPDATTTSAPGTSATETAA